MEREALFLLSPQQKGRRATQEEESGTTQSRRCPGEAARPGSSYFSCCWLCQGKRGQSPLWGRNVPAFSSKEKGGRRPLPILSRSHLAPGLVARRPSEAYWLPPNWQQDLASPNRGLVAAERTKARPKGGEGDGKAAGKGEGDSTEGGDLGGAARGSEAASFVPFSLPAISLRGHPQRPGSAWCQDGVDKQEESGSL